MVDTTIVRSRVIYSGGSSIIDEWEVPLDTLKKYKGGPAAFFESLLVKSDKIVFQSITCEDVND